MVNFGTICSWKIRSLHINRVGGGGEISQPVKFTGGSILKKSLDEVGGDQFENLLTFLKMAATPPPPPSHR